MIRMHPFLPPLLALLLLSATLAVTVIGMTTRANYGH